VLSFDAEDRLLVLVRSFGGSLAAALVASVFRMLAPRRAQPGRFAVHLGRARWASTASSGGGASLASPWAAGGEAPLAASSSSSSAALERARAAVRGSATTKGMNVIAFSGGVDSSLAAALVHEAFPANTLAAIGVSAALPASQLAQAREVAASIGVALRELPTAEGESAEYVANSGNACFHCKTALYDTLRSLGRRLREELGGGERELVLFNGTNADDRRDPTRLGLVAASNFSVASPLADLSKREVRAVARGLALPNWDVAASPCLRSRLAFCVEATEQHLRQVELAEVEVRRHLPLARSENMRVRLLPRQRVAVEVDEHHLPAAEQLLDGWRRAFVLFGLPADVLVRAFASGSVAK